MALKSSREGLRKELVDYLGNIIIDENLKQNIINSVDDAFVNSEELTTSVNELNEKIRSETSAREGTDTILQENINAEISARESADSSLESNKANKSDVLSLEEIQASTDLIGKIASASALKQVSLNITLASDNYSNIIPPSIVLFGNIMSINLMVNLNSVKTSGSDFKLGTINGYSRAYAVDVACVTEGVIGLARCYINTAGEMFVTPITNNCNRVNICVSFSY